MTTTPTRKSAAGRYSPRVLRVAARGAPVQQAVELKPVKDYAAPPLSWEAVHRTVPGAKIFASVLGWGNSFAMNVVDFTLLQTAVYEAKHPGQAAPFPFLGIVAALVMFIILTGGQILTINRSVWGYRVMLAPDVLLSALPWAYYVFAPALTLLVPPRAGLLYTIGTIYAPAAILSAIIGLASAKLPEYLLFGRHPQG